jgi:hypothetical protein
MSSAPVSISAVESNGKSILFYSRQTGQLACLTAQGPEDPASPRYVTSNILLNNNTVEAGSGTPQITAVAYELAGKREIRVYYIDGESTIRELCQTNGGEWYPGSLDSAEYTCAKDSLLTANIEHGSGQLKIFFQQGKNKDAWVAWVVKGQTAWSKRKISDKF